MWQLEERHPGLLRKVDAMLDAFVPIEAIMAMIRTEYDESIGRSGVWRYKRNFWCPQRKRDQVTKAAMIACQELANEGSN